MRFGKIFKRKNHVAMPAPKHSGFSEAITSSNEKDSVNALAMGTRLPEPVQVTNQ